MFKVGKQPLVLFFISDENQLANQNQQKYIFFVEFSLLLDY